MSMISIQGFGSSESSSRSDGLKNLASASAPPSAPQLVRANTWEGRPPPPAEGHLSLFDHDEPGTIAQGLSKEEDSHQPHRESPRGASSSDGLPRACKSGGGSAPPFPPSLVSSTCD